MEATTVTAELAQAALAAVKEQFRSYLEPLTIDGDTYPPTCSQPELAMDYRGEGPAILWEYGPDEWAERVSTGGSSEEERALAAQAADEFGVPYRTPAGVEPAKMPDGVWAEPITSHVLGLYPMEATR